MLLLSASADTTIRLYLINAKKVESIINGRSFLQIPYKSFFYKSIQNITEISSRMNWPRLRWYSLLLFSLENGIRDLKKKKLTRQSVYLRSKRISFDHHDPCDTVWNLIAGETETDIDPLGLAGQAA